MIYSSFMWLDKVYFLDDSDMQAYSWDGHIWEVL